jgi:hypothetical protein
MGEEIRQSRFFYVGIRSKRKRRHEESREAAAAISSLKYHEPQDRGSDCAGEAG